MRKEDLRAHFPREEGSQAGVQGPLGHLGLHSLDVLKKWPLSEKTMVET